MEPQVQPSEYANPSTTEIGVKDSGTITTIPPTSQTDEQWRRVGNQISDFLAQLPDYLGRFFNQYRQPIITVGLILAALITVRVILAVIDALNDIPLLSPTFELIGIAYSAWFVNRFLLKASTRQELTKEIQAIRRQIVGSQRLPES